MSEEKKDQPGENPPEGTFTQELRHSPLSARVPERIARGVLSSGALVQDSPYEFVLDFLQGLTRPPQIVARVIMSPAGMDRFMGAVKDNLGKYEQSFGPPPQMPKPKIERRPTIQEIYEQFKLPEDLYSGVYSNFALIGHSPAEFFFDFITNFYPTSSVACRVYMAAPQVPRFLETLTMSMQRFQQRARQMPPPPPPRDEPPAT